MADPSTGSDMMDLTEKKTDDEPVTIEEAKPEDFSCLVRHLNFSYPAAKQTCLNDVSLMLPEGRRCVRCRPSIPDATKRTLMHRLCLCHRCILVGGNGAGKTTLLRILGGKHMCQDDVVYIMGKNAFKDTRLNFERQFMVNLPSLRAHTTLRRF